MWSSPQTMFLIIVLISMAQPIYGQNSDNGFIAKLLDGTRKLFGLNDKPITTAIPISVNSAISSAIPVPPAQIDIKAVMDKARSALQTGELKQAADSFLTVLDVDPVNIEASSLLGATFLALREPKLAEGFLFTAVKQAQWKDLVAIGNLVECLRLNGDLDLAEQVAMRGLATNSNKDPTGLVSFALGAVLYSKQKYTAAADWYLASAIAQKSNIEAWLRASTVSYPDTYQDYKFAENVLVEAIKANPSNASLLLYFAVTMHNTGRTNEAISLYQHVLMLDPANTDAAKGLSILQQGRH